MRYSYKQNYSARRPKDTKDNKENKESKRKSHGGKDFDSKRKKGKLVSLN